MATDAEPPAEPAEAPIFWDFARDWYQQKALTVGERRQEEVLWALDQHLVWFGRFPVSDDDLTRDRVEEYIDHKVREGRLCAYEINRTSQLLAAILDKAVRRGLLSANPARGEGTRLEVKRPRRIWLELDEVGSLLKAAGDYRAELATLILGGLRIGELGALRWRAVLPLARGTPRSRTRRPRRASGGRST